MEIAMLPEIKKILYATDLSENARYAARYAVALGERFDAEVTILNVIERISANIHSRVAAMLGEEEWQEIQVRRQKEIFTIIQERLRNFCQELQGQLAGCRLEQAEILTREGEPVSEILALAEERPFDLIVMGTRGLGALADAVMGSTARRVIRRAKIPVLVVRLPEETA
jgi:nucleotide-binding universal stress UspA family protein